MNGGTFLSGAVLIGFLLPGPLSTDLRAEDHSGAAHPKGQYKTLDVLPDWGGAWILKRTPPGAATERPALKGRYLLDYEAWQQTVRENDGVVPRRGSNCRPPGMPGMMGTAQYPLEFLFTPGRITILHEAWMQWRNIWTDGRPHPDDLDPGFYGHSIGRWEGETLAVDTIGIKDSVDLGMGMQHSGRLHIVERMHLDVDDADTLVVEMVVDDPEALAQPWYRRFAYTRHRDGELYEFVCAENDRNPVDENGLTRQIFEK